VSDETMQEYMNKEMPCLGCCKLTTRKANNGLDHPPQCESCATPAPQDRGERRKLDGIFIQYGECGVCLKKDIPVNEGVCGSCSNNDHAVRLWFDVCQLEAALSSPQVEWPGEGTAHAALDSWWADEVNLPMYYTQNTKNAWMACYRWLSGKKGI